jgi:hypothetical protein
MSLISKAFALDNIFDTDNRRGHTLKVLKEAEKEQRNGFRWYAEF